MFDLIVTDAGLVADHHTDRDILVHILKELKVMTLDLSKVNPALTKLSADVDALITADAAVAKAVAHATVIHQSQLDALVPSIEAISAKADAVLNPPAPEPAPAA